MLKNPFRHVVEPKGSKLASSTIRVRVKWMKK